MFIAPIANQLKKCFAWRKNLKFHTLVCHSPKLGQVW